MTEEGFFIVRINTIIKLVSSKSYIHIIYQKCVMNLYFNFYREKFIIAQ